LSGDLRVQLTRLLKPSLEEHQALAQCFRREVAALQKALDCHEEQLAQQIEALQEQNARLRETLDCLSEALTSLGAELTRATEAVEERLRSLEGQRRRERDDLNRRLKDLEAALQRLQELYSLLQVEVTTSAESPSRQDRIELLDLSIVSRTVRREPALYLDRGGFRANKAATQILWGFGRIIYAVEGGQLFLAKSPDERGIALGGKTYYGRPLPGGRALAQRILGAELTRRLSESKARFPLQKTEIELEGVKVPALVANLAGVLKRGEESVKGRTGGPKPKGENPPSQELVEGGGGGQKAPGTSVLDSEGESDGEGAGAERGRPEASVARPPGEGVEPTRERELPSRIRILTTSPQPRRRIPPESRGGRPRVGVEAEADAKAKHGQEPKGETEAAAKVEGDEPRSGDPSGRRPTLVCRKQGRGWQVLREEDEGRSDAVGVDATELFGEEGLLFKLESTLERGRRVRRVSRGWYLAIVPDGWERLGTAPIAPESVALPGYRAHYFDLTEEGQIRFHVGDSERVPWQRVEFCLVGEELRDDAQHLGPLFREPPRVRAPRSLWTEVSEVVIREERPGTGRWKTSFPPNAERDEQTLPEELAERGGGRYTLLFYDHDWELLDSFDFRFFLALQGIHVEPEGPVVLPGPEGHRPARITFLHEVGCRIEPSMEPSFSIKLNRKPTRTEVELPPDPTLDQTYWRAQKGSASVDLVIRIPRIWWALGPEGAEPEADEWEWQAEALSLKREDLAATSEKVLWLRVPPGVRRVRCGFPGDLRRFDRRNSSLGQLWVAVPLREFCDSGLRDRPGRTPLQLQDPLEEQEKTTVGWLKVCLACRYCDFKAWREEALWEHLFQEHRSELYREPKWEELRRWIPHLPKYILACPYCDEYAEADDPYSTSTITLHVEKVHKTRTKYSSGPGFRIVRSVDEIRNKMTKYKDLPRFQICQLCGNHFDLREVSREELLRHLKGCHWGEVARLV